ncbi:MAG TPA: biotin--[acetyl-CoA-carboxylase] ligase [Stellaceae bacterium]|nr:biotin--[acetyl-CoA-carboxylase] ligase [Stellaceae bacterium]
MTGGSGLPAFFRLHRFAELDSTNEEAKRQAAAGAPAGTLISALAQRAGRGRRGRAWVSPPGNLYMSILLRPERSAGASAQLGFAGALAVGEAVLPLLPEAAELAYKWPNDVLVDGRKVSGILLESQAAGEGRIDWLVVGIGVNLASFPATGDYPATSLAAAGAAPVAVETLLEAVARSFHIWYERWLEHGFAPLRRGWLARARGLGQPIRVRLPQGESEGRFAGLDEDGALLLDTGTARQRIAAGDVFPAAR